MIGNLSERMTSIEDLKNKIKEELDKCDILCSNCHSEEHFDRDFFNNNIEKIFDKVKAYKEINFIIFVIMKDYFEYNGEKYFNGFQKIYGDIMRLYIKENNPKKKQEIKDKLDELKKLIAKEVEQNKIEFWKNFNKELKNPEDVPNLPKGDIYLKYTIPALIRCGAIPKNKLKINHFYYGEWRRGNFAKWDGEKFHVWRYKWEWFLDTCNHFEDDDGYALFVPIKEITEDEFNQRLVVK